MPVSPHKADPMPRTARGPKIQMALAFFAIYVLWGCTFLAIRIAVEHIPPLQAAGIRFFIAGAVLCVWARWRSAPKPTLAESGRSRHLDVSGHLQRTFLGRAADSVGGGSRPGGHASDLDGFARSLCVSPGASELAAICRHWPRLFGDCAPHLQQPERQTGTGPLPCHSRRRDVLGAWLGVIALDSIASVEKPDGRKRNADWRHCAPDLFPASGRTTNFWQNSFPSVAGVSVFGGGGLSAGLYGVCMAARTGACHTGLHARLCKPGGGASAGSLAGRRADRMAHLRRQRSHSRQCRGDFAEQAVPEMINRRRSRSHRRWQRVLQQHVLKYRWCVPGGTCRACPGS